MKLNKINKRILYVKFHREKYRGTFPHPPVGGWGGGDAAHVDKYTMVISCHPASRPSKVKGYGGGTHRSMLAFDKITKIFCTIFV